MKFMKKGKFVQLSHSSLCQKTVCMLVLWYIETENFLNIVKYSDNNKLHKGY